MLSQDVSVAQSSSRGISSVKSLLQRSRCDGRGIAPDILGSRRRLVRAESKPSRVDLSKLQP